MTASHYKNKAARAARALETLAVAISDHLGRDEYNNSVCNAYKAMFWAKSLVRNLELEMETFVNNSLEETL